MSTAQTMRRIMITMPPGLLQQTDEAATRLHSNRSKFIRRAIEFFL